jgi:DNA-3-methyladenine glycosylase
LYVMDFGPIISRAFYDRPTDEVARDLLGKVLVHGRTAGIIVETEAYPGGDDRASHSSRGITERTRVIFGPPGHAYVYFIYGMYECFNITVDREGTGGCVLVRALEPVDGIPLMRRRRPTARGIEDLANGPGKLTLAMGITRGHYGADLTRGTLVVREPARPAPVTVVATPRIGITHNADRELRFTIAGNRFVSRIR